MNSTRQTERRKEGRVVFHILFALFPLSLLLSAIHSLFNTRGGRSRRYVTISRGQYTEFSCMTLSKRFCSHLHSSLLFSSLLFSPSLLLSLSGTRTLTHSPIHTSLSLSPSSRSHTHTHIHV